MQRHDADDPVTAHIRVTIATPDDQQAVQSIAVETLHWNKAPGSDRVESLDVLVNLEQLDELRRRGVAFRSIAPVLTREAPRKQEPHGDRYQRLVNDLRRSDPEK